MTSLRGLLHLVLSAAILASGFLFLPVPAAGQTEVQRILQQQTGTSATQDQILQRLRQSGITRAQARARLQQAGYDPDLLDPYFDRLEGRESSLSETDQEFLSALDEIGLAVQEESAGLAALQALQDSLARQRDTLTRPEEQSDEEGPQVFGLSLFRRATDQFQPVTTGPVDPDYRLGPGDEIVLILTGDVELAYTLDVTREGFIVIPDVGQVSVNGLTLRSLRDRLYDRLGQVYSGVRRGPDATTHFDVSLGRLRTNQVFVIGDVARPGAYQVSSVGTAMTALYAAGGPTEMGSFRSVSVIRDGEEISEVDLYDYLLRGDASRDVRLFQGDVVFVPPSDAQVRIQGQVRRPAIYEMKTGETLTDLIRFAGGFEPTAHVRRVQVDRILPPDQREPGRDRVLLDANVLALATGTGPDFPLLPGDRVTVSGVLDRQEGRVRIGGAVWRPGVYEYRPGMTVWDLIGEAEGLQPSAYQLTAHVHRLVEETGARRLLRVSLEKDAGGDLVQDLPLADLDSVRVFNTDSLRMPDSVAISGQVRESGTYLLDEGMTVQDLILTAGGFTRGAIGYEAEVVRLTEGLTRTDTLAVEYRVSVEGGIPHPLGDTVFRAPPEAGPYHARAADFVLQGTDHVFVRRLPGWVGRGSVQVSGEIAVPGRYAFEFRQERLSSFVRRAGGPTEQAYLPGARLVRDSVLVGIELEEALADPGGPEDVLLEQDDELVIPEYDPTVLVQGAVAFPTRVIYREGWGVDEYLSEAGGSTQDADMDRLSVRYQNGSRATTRDYKLFRNYPDVGPGTTIIVPAKAEDVTNWDRFNRILTQTLSTTATILTIVLTVDRLGG